MLSKGELGLTILVPVIVGAGLLYVFYLFQTGRGCDCTMAGGVLGSSRRRAAEDAALQEMTELKHMFSQLTKAQKKKRQRQAKSHDGVSADSGATENVADVPNDQREDGEEEEMANRC
jgi:hypothetical protein